MSRPWSRPSAPQLPDNRPESPGPSTPAVTRSEWALLALNAFASFLGSLEPDDDVAVLVFFVVLAAAVANGVYVVRRGRERPAVRRRVREAEHEALDARQVLELDQRLEALGSV